MTVNSMTGFARSEGSHEGTAWTWEIRSVNSRNLDIRFRLPPGHDQLEAEGRRAVSKRFKRGSVSASLNLSKSPGQSQIRLNPEVLEQVVAMAEELKERTGLSARPDGLLSLKGVIEMTDETIAEEDRDARMAALSRGLDEALDRLAEARGDEGKHVKDIIEDHLSEIERLTAEAVATASAQPRAIKERLEQQLAELLAPDATVSSERLEQEIALLATRADVREEVDRLKAHALAARELIGGGGAIGRRLDFLCQEFNREANTLCSKSSDMELTRIGLDLKAVIDRLREQIQNIE